MVETISILAIMLVLGIAALAVVALVEYYKEQDVAPKKYYVVAKSRSSLDLEPGVSFKKGPSKSGYRHNESKYFIVSDMYPYLGKVIGEKGNDIPEPLYLKGWHWEPWMYEITDKPVIISNKLEEFLRREPGLYERFVANTRLDWDDSRVKIEQTLLGAFLWKDSIEGYDFWRGIEREYEQYLKNKI